MRTYFQWFALTYGITLTGTLLARFLAAATTTGCPSASKSWDRTEAIASPLAWPVPLSRPSPATPRWPGLSRTCRA
jgi:hypothetical protein